MSSVSSIGFEPTRPFEHQHLKLAWLPVTPRRQSKRSDLHLAAVRLFHRTVLAPPALVVGLLAYQGCAFFMAADLVYEEGVEPSRPKAPEPKSGASANSATRTMHATSPSSRTSFDRIVLLGVVTKEAAVLRRGVEPPRPCDHCGLNAARLPLRHLSVLYYLPFMSSIACRSASTIKSSGM